MFEMAFKARLPVISIATTDTVNVLDVLDHYLGGVPARYMSFTGEKEIISFLDNSRYEKDGSRIDVLIMGKPEIPLERLYTLMIEREMVSILINYRDERVAFNAGVLPTPKKKLESLLTDLVPTEQIEAYTKSLSGLTIKESGEVLRLTMAQSMGLSPRSVSKTRALAIPAATGIEAVNTEYPMYLPPDDLEGWAAENREFFLGDHDSRLVPRGLLLYGPPGTGKTMYGKYLANQWGIALYRLDLSGLMTKWLGEAENNLRQALAHADNEGPCVLLLDEVEKIFGGLSDSDNATTTRMLSQLLWWLQEHRSKVLVVMTTNDIGKLPPELYRQGRIDRAVKVDLISLPQAIVMARKLVGTYQGLTPEELESVWSKCSDKLLSVPVPVKDKPIWAPVAVNQIVVDAIKEVKKHLTNA